MYQITCNSKIDIWLDKEMYIVQTTNQGYVNIICNGKTKLFFFWNISKENQKEILFGDGTKFNFSFIEVQIFTFFFQQNFFWYEKPEWRTWQFFCGLKIVLISTIFKLKETVKSRKASSCKLFTCRIISSKFIHLNTWQSQIMFYYF